MKPAIFSPVSHNTLIKIAILTFAISVPPTIKTLFLYFHNTQYYTNYYLILPDYLKFSAQLPIFLDLFIGFVWAVYAAVTFYLIKFLSLNDSYVWATNLIVLGIVFIGTYIDALFFGLVTGLFTTVVISLIIWVVSCIIWLGNKIFSHKQVK